MNQNIISIESLRSQIINTATLDSDVSLYTGKIGSSIALIESNELFYSEIAEEHIVKFIKETLKYELDYIDFSSGITGIGYAILYMIKKGHLENDYDKYFSKNRMKIIKIMISILPYVNNDIPILFLDIAKYSIQSYSIDRNKYEKLIIDTILQKVTTEVTKCFSPTNWTRLKTPKHSLLEKFSKLLELYNLLIEEGLVNLFDIEKIKDTITSYCTCYNENYIVNNYTLGYRLIKTSQDNSIINIAKQNIAIGIEGIHYKSLSLTEKIKLFHSTKGDFANRKTGEMILNDISSKISETQNIQFKIPYGLTDGASLLLLHVLNQEIDNHPGKKQIDITKII